MYLYFQSASVVTPDVCLLSRPTCGRDRPDDVLECWQAHCHHQYKVQSSCDHQKCKFTKYMNVISGRRSFVHMQLIKQKSVDWNIFRVFIWRTLSVNFVRFIWIKNIVIPIITSTIGFQIICLSTLSITTNSNQEAKD